MYFEHTTTMCMLSGASLTASVFTLLLFANFCMPWCIYKQSVLLGILYISSPCHCFQFYINFWIRVWSGMDQCRKPAQLNVNIYALPVHLVMSLFLIPLLGSLFTVITYKFEITATMLITDMLIIWNGCILWKWAVKGYANEKSMGIINSNWYF